jgi:L-threonylcarbamoyladenylate synthase
MALLFSNSNDNNLIKEIARGAVGVLPTDTVYGLVASARNHHAVVGLYKLKLRENKPGTVIAANAEQLIKLGVDNKCIDGASIFWPNPISIILPVGPDLHYLSQGLGSIAFRVVADDALRTLLEKTGPLLTSSANDPGDPPATTIQMAKDYFQDKVAYYVDGGKKSDNPSTIIQIQDAGVKVIRQGVFVLPPDAKVL